MENNMFLIPANSKRSLLIFGAFREFDLILFGSGSLITLLMVVILPMDNLYLTILALAPGLITGFLVMPIPNYHNVLNVIYIAFKFFTTDQNYIWKGWCFRDGKDNE
jgi:hypothetical protein